MQKSVLRCKWLRIIWKSLIPATVLCPVTGSNITHVFLESRMFFWISRMFCWDAAVVIMMNHATLVATHACFVGTRLFVCATRCLM